MRIAKLPILAISAALASAAYAQSYQRQAVIVGGGSQDSGKCTIEVAVDSAAQVEIRGTTATLRNLSGRPAQWRRFECTAALPANPANFSFRGIDGRGRQELIRDPRNGGVAVVQIEDKDGGSEGYTFDIMWDSRGFDNGPNRNSGPIGSPGYRENDRGVYGEDNSYRAEGQYRPNYRDSGYYRRYGHGFAVEEAVRVCQQEVLKQAARRFRSNDIHFNRTRIDDSPGRDDWVMGSLDVYRGAREERFGFSCSVNFDDGRVRTAEIDSRPLAIGPR